MLPDSERQPLLATRTNVSIPGSNQLDKDDEAATAAEEVTWRTETKLIVGYSLPMTGTYLLQYFYNLIIILVCSRLSTEELAAVSLGITTSNIIGYAIFEGMTTALDTLCAQAFGAGNLQLVGVHTVRFTILVHIVAIPISMLWFFSPHLMVYLVPSTDLAQTAGTFLRWSLLGIPGYATFEAGKRFMQAQGNFTCGLMIMVACLPVNIFLNWLLVFYLDFRIAGAALAASLTNLIRPPLLIFYATYIDRRTLQCWPTALEWSSLWTNWKPMVRLAIPGVVMTLSEWGAFEILTFATSYVSNAALAAQTFLTTAVVIVWHIPWSASVVTSTRIGQLIGGGHLETAKKVSAYYVYMFVVIGAMDMALSLGLFKVVIHYLAMDEAVRWAVVGSVWLAILFCFFDCMLTCMHGIVRGLGWQSIGGWITVLWNYLYGVPLALFLELGPPKMGLQGLWAGIASCLALIAVTEGLIIRARSWDRVTGEAQARQEL